MKPTETMLRLALLTSMLAVFWACKKNPVGPQVTPNVELSAEYVACTEVWLKLGFADSPSGGDYRITRDGETVLHGSFSGTNTVVYDTTALANKTYSYVAYRLVNGQVSQISATVAVTTLDSTSNNFTWQTFTLGDGNSSMLNSVTIVNDTLAYATGQIFFRDSTGYYNLFNLCRWNGSHWDFMQLKFFPPNAVGDSEWGEGQAIFANSPNDIWCVAGTVFHFDGMRWLPVYNTGADVADAIWSNASGQTWFVGKNGTIIEYGEQQWHSLTTGTSNLISNVWGDGGRVVCVTTESRLLSISGNQVSDKLSWSGVPIRGIWFSVGTPMYVSGQGVWVNDGLGWKQVIGLPDVFCTGIRGTATNDLVAIGPYGTLAHYNGSTWYVYNQLANQSWDFQSIAVTDHLVAAVGFEGAPIGGKAVAVIGTRIQ